MNSGYLFNDTNITFNKNNIVIESNTISLLSNLTYVKAIFKYIIENIDEITTLLSCNYFTIRIDGYVIDGLYESNSLLINSNSIVSPLG